MGAASPARDFEQGAFARTAGANDQAELFGAKVEGNFFEDGFGGGGGMVANVAQVEHHSYLILV